MEEHVIRGEIDNRTRGRVTGRIWFAGRDDPIVLDLIGNAWRDLAGRCLEFVNPEPQPGFDSSFAGQQCGTTGDMTASRKVKVPDIPLDQIGEYYAARKPFPWHWGNSVYLEWFSATNGRVVIESASYQLTISSEPTWEMTPAEEQDQRARNAAGLDLFVEQAGEVLAAKNEDDPNRPPTEAEAEKMQAASDRLTDRVLARMEREGAGANFEKIMSEEIERARKERGEPDLTPEEEADRARHIEEMNAASAEALEQEKADSWKGSEKAAGDAFDDPFADKHPLSARSLSLALRVMREIEERGWLAEDDGHEHPVAVLVAGLTGAGAKLAGALDAEDWPPPLDFCAGMIVRLKKAASYLEDAKLAGESCREEVLVDAAWLAEVMREIHALAAETDALILELRARLKTGF